MTLTDPRSTTAIDFTTVTLDLYRDIHKGIRSELFAVTTEAGSIDPADDLDVAALATHVSSTVEVLVSHAEHEDGAIQPVLERELPSLAERIATDHTAIEARMEDLVALASGAVDAAVEERRRSVHRLYVEWAAFTADYLQHQDVEERVVMPALETAVGFEAVLAIHGAILAAIPPEEMATSLAMMLPAMNIDDRTEMLGGMREGAPAEVFDGVWSLAGSVLTASDHVALGRRLGLA